MGMASCTLGAASCMRLPVQMATVGAPSSDPEAERRRQEEEEERRIAELRAHGTPVTPEAFAEWKVGRRPGSQPHVLDLLPRGRVCV